MARIQILELPAEQVGEFYRTPFAIIIDRNELSRIEAFNGDVVKSIPRDVSADVIEVFRVACGARAVLVVDGEIEIG